MESYTFQPTAGGPWDTTEPYVFNTCAFTIYHLKLALALKMYVIPKDDTSTALSDDTITEILTDLKQNTEKMDCTNLKAQVEEAYPEVIREVEEKKERWGAEGDEVYHNWYLKTQAPDYIRALHATYI